MILILNSIRWSDFVLLSLFVVIERFVIIDSIQSCFLDHLIVKNIDHNFTPLWIATLASMNPWKKITSPNIEH